MTLVKAPFGATFAFSRSVAADYRDAAGTVQTAAIDVARFDHHPDGEPRGLLVEPGPGFGNHDAIATLPGWDAGVTQGTVLHEFEQDGQIRRVAFYASNLKAMADACLRAGVHHREIKALDGLLRNRGGYVRHDGRNWSLGDALQTMAGGLTEPVLGDSAGRPLIEG